MSNCFECKHLEKSETVRWSHYCLRVGESFNEAGREDRETMADCDCEEFEPKVEEPIEPTPITRAHCERPECAYCGEPLSWHSLFAASYPCPKCGKESKVETTYTSTGVDHD